MVADSSRLLITGAAGFIGSQIVRLAVERGYEVHGLDLVGAPALALVGVHDHRMPRGREDFADLLTQVRPQICIHAAGAASVGASLDHPEEDFRSGPVLTFALLDAIRKAAPHCRLTFLSSAAVYGNPATLPVRETQSASPISPYGFHKLQCELICSEFSSIFGLQTAVIRIFSAFGNGLRRQILWDICRQLAAGKAPLLRGTGTETRDFIHVHDVAAGALLVAERGNAKGDIYNLAYGQETSIHRLASLATAAFGKNVVPCFDGTVPAGDPLCWCADIAKIRALGFAPAVTLEAGIASYVEWMRQQTVA
jgi:UDP-glucose 4-epimerase